MLLPHSLSPSLSWLERGRLFLEIQTWRLSHPPSRGSLFLYCYGFSLSLSLSLSLAVRFGEGQPHTNNGNHNFFCSVAASSDENSFSWNPSKQWGTNERRSGAAAAASGALSFAWPHSCFLSGPPPVQQQAGLISPRVALGVRSTLCPPPPFALSLSPRRRQLSRSNPVDGPFHLLYVRRRRPTLSLSPFSLSLSPRLTVCARRQ